MGSSQENRRHLFVRSLCVCAVLCGVFGVGSFVSVGLGQHRASVTLDADASGTLDFFDVAVQLGIDDADAFIAFFVDSIEREGSGVVEVPTDRSIVSVRCFAACAPARDRQDGGDTVAECHRAHFAVTRHGLHPERGALPRGMCAGTRCARGPPALL